MVAVVTYMLARYPASFPAMLDDALSTLSPKPTAMPAERPARYIPNAGNS